MKSALSNALCQSYDIRDSGWLKTAILYWDSLNYLSSTEVNDFPPFFTSDANYLIESNFLNCIHVDFQKLMFKPFDYIDSEDIFNLFFTTIPYNDSISPLNDEWKNQIKNKCYSLGINFNKSSEYYIKEDYIYFRMAFIENNICESYSLAPVSSKMGTLEYYNMIRRGRSLLQQGNSEQGLMFDLAINNLNISPQSEIKKIISFKEKRKDELSLFRTHISRLTQSIQQDQPFEAIKEDVNNTYKNEFLPAYNNFKKVLRDYNIIWITDNIFKIFTMSIGSAGIHQVVGLPEQQVLLMGAGIILGVSNIKYSINKQKNIRENPNSYLLEIEKKYKNTSI